MELQSIQAWLLIITELLTIICIPMSMFAKLRKISTGTKCQLRSEMLRIYYHNKDKAEMRQYEYENFLMLYEAYKALKGNSFIDKIKSEIETWKIIS